MIKTTISYLLTGVRCHTCGSLFSGGNPNCEEFDASDPTQQDFCKVGEACLWYSWQKSDTETSQIRECFSPSILLGPINDPLTLADTCSPKDISETPGSSIMACLCNTPLCNANNGGSGPVALPRVAPKKKTSSRTQKPSRPKTPQRTQSSNNFEDELSREELAALAQFGSINQQKPRDPSEVPRSRIPQNNNRNRVQSDRNKPSSNRRPSSSSASAFNPNKEVLRKCLSVISYFLFMTVIFFDN